MMTPLQRFMDLVGADDVEVAEATGLHRTAIYYIRLGDRVPHGETLVRLVEWADEVARRKRIRTADRFCWQEQVRRGGGKARGGDSRARGASK